MEGVVYGRDCVAANLVLQIGKLRYKDGKGDPKAFTAALKNKSLNLSLLPRYRGNRLHILFKTCEILIINKKDIIDILENSLSACGGLTTSCLKDYKEEEAQLQIQALALVGKFLTGPWMHTFYASTTDTLTHLKGFEVIKGVLDKIKLYIESPELILTSAIDFFDNEIENIIILQDKPINIDLFYIMIKDLLINVVNVIDRQYKTYFTLIINNKIEEITRSASLNNINLEEIMDMFIPRNIRPQMLVSNILVHK